MKRYPISGRTSTIAGPDGLWPSLKKKDPLWRELKEEIGQYTSIEDRREILRACLAFRMRVIEKTQNATPGQLADGLARVAQLADELSEALQDRSLGDQLAGMLDHRLARWPAYADTRTRIMELLFVLESACCHEAGAIYGKIPPLPAHERVAVAAARRDLLDRLGAVYERVSGKAPGYSKPDGDTKQRRPESANCPYGPFVRFYQIIAARLLPPEVEHADLAHAVKNWKPTTSLGQAGKKFG